MSDLRVLRRLDRHRVHHDARRHIAGPLLRDRAPAERGREDQQAEGPGVDRSDMDLRVLVLGGAGAGPGVQPVRAGGLPDQLQFRLPDGRGPGEIVHPGVLRGRVVRAVHHDIVLLREDTARGVGDQRDGGQPVRPGGGEAEDGDPARLRGGRRHRAVVRVVDAVRHGRTAGRVRPEGVHHAAELDDPGAVLQGGQLHGPVDIRHHASQVQERADQAAVEEEGPEAGAGLRHEEGMEPFKQERPRLQEPVEHRGRGRRGGDRADGRPRRQDAPAGVDVQSQDQRDPGPGDPVPAHQAGESQVHAAQLVQNAQDLVQE